MFKEIDLKVKKCIDDCSDCYQVCVATLAHCQEMGGIHAEPKHLTLLKDCAEICKTSESFMLRGSLHAPCVAQECAKICEQCADSCEKVDPRDIQMMECVKMCRECAASCKEMV
jgi:hypothetical protein